ncbi:MAG: 2-oxo acid dehydrogenase subunit E2, partial [Nitrospira sp.]
GRLDVEAARPGIINRVGGVVVQPMTPQEGSPDHYSPAVRQLAKEHGVDLSQVSGSGADGRITKKDVLDAVAKRREPVNRPGQPDTSVAEELIPFSQMRKTIAERVVSSRRTSAHAATFFEADFSGISKFREGRGLTYLPFVIAAVARTLNEMPILNASWGEHGIIIKKEVHVAVAVALDEGLLAPVIRHADRKGLLQLAKEVSDLAERARNKRLNPEEAQGGTFTITNHGGFGSLFSTPIINQPQIAILGVGAVQKRPIVLNDAIAIRPMGYLSLSFDHRVIDGATADRFMSKVKGRLEAHDWEKLL